MRSVNELVDWNEELTRTVEAQAPLAESALIERLLNGEISDASELDAFSRRTGFFFGGELFIGAVLCAGRPDKAQSLDKDLALFHAAARDLLSRLFSRRAHCLYHEPDKLIVLFNLEQAEPSAAKEEMEIAFARLAEALQAAHGLSPTLYCGEPRTEPLSVRDSFADARRTMLRDYPESPGRILWPAVQRTGASAVAYPLEAELRLYKAVLAARADGPDGFEGILAGVRAAAASGPSVSDSTAADLFAQIRGTLRRASDELGIAEDTQSLEASFEALPASASLDLFFETARGNAAAIADAACRKKKSHNERLALDLRAYLESHFSDRDLSLSLVADRFRISEGYLCQFLKEQTGETFLSYVTRLRIAAARKLIAETERPLAEIASAIGYANADTFRKAFKRSTGINPASIRE
jgi:AraC-like DNA-binding protein